MKKRIAIVAASIIVVVFTPVIGWLIYKGLLHFKVDDPIAAFTGILAGFAMAFCGLMGAVWNVGEIMEAQAQKQPLGRAGGGTT